MHRTPVCFWLRHLNRKKTRKTVFLGNQVIKSNKTCTFLETSAPVNELQSMSAYSTPSEPVNSFWSYFRRFTGIIQPVGAALKFVSFLEYFILLEQIHLLGSYIPSPTRMLDLCFSNEVVQFPKVYRHTLCYKFFWHFKIERNILRQFKGSFSFKVAHKTFCYGKDILFLSNINFVDRKLYLFHGGNWLCSVAHLFQV